MPKGAAIARYNPFYYYTLEISSSKGLGKVNVASGVTRAFLLGVEYASSKPN